MFKTSLALARDTDKIRNKKGQQAMCSPQRIKNQAKFSS